MSAVEWRGLIAETHAGAPWTEIDMVPWFEAQIHVESRGNAAAVSPAGAVGLMQIMPGTGLELGLQRDQLLDPRLNVHAGMKYMRQMYDRLERYVPDSKERLFWAFAAYNGGILYARKAIELCGRDQSQIDSSIQDKPWLWNYASKWYMHEQCCRVLDAGPERRVLRPRYQETWSYVSRIRRYRANLSTMDMVVPVAK